METDRDSAATLATSDETLSSGMRVTSGMVLTFRPPPTSFRFVDEYGAREVLVLHRDGRVEIGAHLTPDEAGQKVFEILKTLWAQHMGGAKETE